MKKITIAILMLLGSFSMASAELGVKLGASLNIGVFHATGTDLDASSPTTGAAGGAATTQSEDATGVAGFTSFFIEKDLSFLPGPFATAIIFLAIEVLSDEFPACIARTINAAAS